MVGSNHNKIRALFAACAESMILVTGETAAIEVDPAHHGCDSQNHAFVIARSDIDYGVFKTIAVTWECASDEQTVNLTDGHGNSVEIDRFSARYAAVTIIKPPRQESMPAPRMVAVSYGFDWSGEEDAYRVDVYDLALRAGIFSAASSHAPVISDFNRDGKAELLLFEDAFAIRHPEAPAWPRAYQLADRLIEVPQSQSRPILEIALTTSLEARGKLLADCKYLKTSPCPLMTSLSGLQHQIDALEAILREKK